MQKTINNSLGEIFSHKWLSLFMDIVFQYMTTTCLKSRLSTQKGTLCTLTFYLVLPYENLSLKLNFQFSHYSMIFKLGYGHLNPYDRTHMKDEAVSSIAVLFRQCRRPCESKKCLKLSDKNFCCKSSQKMGGRTCVFHSQTKYFCQVKRKITVAII